MTKVFLIHTNLSKTGSSIFRRFTPNNSGKWKNLVSIDNWRDADYIVGINTKYISAPGFSPEQFIYVKDEPEEFYFTRAIWAKLPKGSHRIKCGWSSWEIHKSYDELTDAEFPVKTKNLSCVTSNIGDGTQPVGTQILSGHRLRMRFLQRFLKEYPEEMDLYGRNLTSLLYDYPCNKGVVEDKWDALQDYRYSFAFENSWQRDYFTPKIADCILAGCMPIYWGCPNLEEYLPRNSFIRLDISREDSSEQAMEIIKSDYCEQHIKDLYEAKHFLLNEYNFWEVLHKCVMTNSE